MPSTNPLSGFDFSGFSGDKVTEALKIHYKDLRVRNMVYKDNPFLAMVPKYTKFGGLSMPIPIRFHDPQRRSATFASGQGNTSTSGLKQFSITRARDYSFAFVDGETILASQGDQNAFLRYLTMEIDGAINSLSRSLAVAMYGDGSGSLGTALSVSTDTIQLSKAEDVTNFEVGMTIVSAANNTAAAPGTETNIVAVDRQLGKITVTTGEGGNVSDGDLIFQKGDYVSAGDRLKVFGLDAWLPATAPTSGESFNTVDRSADPTRLAGVRFDGTSMPIEEALIGAAASVARDGGRPDCAFVDFKTYASLEKSLGSRVRYSTVKAPKVDIGFSGISIAGPKGDIKVLPDFNCTPDTIYLLQMDTWVLATLGDAPQFLDRDGNKMLRDSGSDAYEVRLGYYGNLGCYAPGHNCRISLA